MTDSPPLHEHLAPLLGLLGTWEGDGHGDYPTIEPFHYRERVAFGHVGKPFLAYQQRTWHPGTGMPMHAEMGYLRLPSDVTPESSTSAAPSTSTVRVSRPAELVLAHPTGIVEIEEGALEDGILRLATTTIGLSRTAKQVRSLRREFRLQGDTLSYDLWMAYAHVPETHHLGAVLTRIDTD